MNNEEVNIRKIVGSRTPFRVPEGYFDSFTSQVMEKLPDNTFGHRAFSTRIKSLRSVWYVAACACIAVFGVAAYWNAKIVSHDNDIVTSDYQKVSSYTYEDEVIDCAMMDNADIYAYLSDE